MPSVSRSQLPAQVLQALNPIGEVRQFLTLASEAWTPLVGESVSAILGTIIPEIIKPAPTRFSAFTYVFTPSQLRTKFLLDYITINLPQTKVFLGKVEAGKPEGEFEIEQGWIGNLQIAGQNYFTPTFTSVTSNLLITEAAGNEFVVPQKFAQVSFTQQILAVAGVSIEFQAIPYVRILKVIKKTTIVGAVSDLTLSTEKNAQTSATLVYTQEFEK